MLTQNMLSWRAIVVVNYFAYLKCCDSCTYDLNVHPPGRAAIYVSCGLAARGIQPREGRARGGTEGCYAGEAAALAIPAVTGFQTAGVRAAVVGSPPLALRGKVRSLECNKVKTILAIIRSVLAENVEFKRRKVLSVIANIGLEAFKFSCNPR